MFGVRNSQIATLVERQTRYLMLVKVAAKDTETVVDASVMNTRKGSRWGSERSWAYDPLTRRNVTSTRPRSRNASMSARSSGAASSAVPPKRMPTR